MLHYNTNPYSTELVFIFIQKFKVNIFFCDFLGLDIWVMQHLGLKNNFYLIVSNSSTDSPHHLQTLLG